MPWVVCAFGPCTSKVFCWFFVGPIESSLFVFRSLFDWRHKVHKFCDFGFWLLPKKLGQQKYRLSGFSVVGYNVSSIHQGVSCRFAFVKKRNDWRACVVRRRTLMVQKIWLASASGDRVGHSFLIVRCTPSHLIDCIGLKFTQVLLIST